MATLATKSMTFDQMREVFADLADFMALLRGPKDALDAHGRRHDSYSVEDQLPLSAPVPRRLLQSA
jgi:hypothetical protein